jgi:hypothetical protein
VEKVVAATTTSAIMLGRWLSCDEDEVMKAEYEEYLKCARRTIDTDGIERWMMRNGKIKRPVRKMWALYELGVGDGGRRD